MKIIEVLREIAAMTDPEDPDSYRSDDPQGCLETVYWKTKNAVLAAEGEPDFLAACQPTPDTNRLSSLAYILDRYDALEDRTRVKPTKADKEARERTQELLADLRAALARVSGAGSGEGVTSA